MSNKTVPLVLLCTASFLQAQVNSSAAVRFHTTLGDIDVTLLPDTTPKTVANFLSYMNKGAYVNSIFHRSVPGFIIQGGGYQLQNHAPVATPQDPAVPNEFKVSNTRGTIAMAKLGSDPNSATNQWFFNLANNATNLDGQNGGFTVFGNVTNAAGLAVMDKIAALPVYNAGSPFDQLPLNNYKAPTVVDSNYVLVTSIVQLPSVTASGFESAASFASTSGNGIAPGELLTIFGQAIGPAQLTTLTFDPNGLVNTSLGGTQVLFDGQAAPLIYTSANQLSVIAPYSLAGKSTTKLIVVYQGVQTATMQFPVVAANPAIFTLNSSGSGDAVIERLDASVVTTANPAAPGDILILYAEGYGATSPALADGAIVGTSLPLPVNKPVLLIDGQAVDTLYAGGAPAIVNGVLQVNFKVPALTPGGHSIQLQVAGRTSPAGVNLQTR